MKVVCAHSPVSPSCGDRADCDALRSENMLDSTALFAAKLHCEYKGALGNPGWLTSSVRGPSETLTCYAAIQIVCAHSPVSPSCGDRAGLDALHS